MPEPPQPTRTAAGSPAHCRHCGRALDALSQRRGLPHCGAAACRQGAEAEALKARRQALGLHAVQRAQRQQAPSAPPPALVWLQPAQRELEPVSPALREALAESWRRRAAEGWRHAYPGSDSATALPAAATVLCAQCGGGCCAHGGRLDAFVDIDVLRRWQEAHPGSSTEDAITDYLSRLPEVHVKNGCGFQGATGCVLPRERRADVCNRYACKPLQDLAEALQETPGRAAVVLTVDGRQLERAALLQDGRITAMTGLPQPDDLPPP